jgi:hypothetical protein
MSQCWSKAAILCAMALSCVPAMADGDGASRVSGAGLVVLRPKATKLRLQLALGERGDDMTQTEKRLDRKCDAIRTALLAAKATPGSIHIDAIRLAGVLRAVGTMGPMQQQGEREKWYYPMAQQQAPPPEQRDVSSSPASPERHDPRITLQTQITAEWPLQAATTAQLLVEADGIVRRVHERMIQEKTLAVAANEKAAESIASSGKQSDKPPQEQDTPAALTSEPLYLFVATISQKQLREAYAKAYESATADATRKASITGSAIGPALDIDLAAARYDASAEDTFESSYPASILSPSSVAPIKVEPPAGATRAGSVEVVNYDPSSIVYSIFIHATFRLHTPSDRNTESK